MINVQGVFVCGAIIIDRRLVRLLEDLAQLVRLVFARDDEVVDIF